MARFDKRHEGPWFYVAIAILIFLVWSGAVAVGTADDCGNGVDRSWNFVPPRWDCEGRLPGYG